MPPGDIPAHQDGIYPFVVKLSRPWRKKRASVAPQTREEDNPTIDSAEKRAELIEKIQAGMSTQPRGPW